MDEPGFEISIFAKVVGAALIGGEFYILQETK